MSVLLEELRKVALVGVGGSALALEKSQEIVDELVEKGKLSVDEGKALTSRLVQRHKKDGDGEGYDREELEALLIEMNVAQRKDIDELEERVRELENRLDKQEA